MIRTILSFPFRNRFSQLLLEFTVRKLLKIMGIGAGTNVERSGERIIFKKLKSIMGESCVVFDVGSNQGQYFNLAFSEMGALNAKYYLFEPSCKTFEILLKNTKNKSQNTVFNNLGLSSEKGSMTLYTDKVGSGLASLTKRDLTHVGLEMNDEEKVEVDTVDNYCMTNSINTIDLLKIDVEGHELAVLQGSERMLKKALIKIIQIEFGGCNLDTRTTFRDFYNLFHDSGFCVYRLSAAGYLFEIKKYKEFYEQFTTTNYVAIHKNYIS